MRKALEDITVRACEIAKPKAGDIVIDIGCNDGTLLHTYNIPELRLVGFEPAKNLIEEARRGTEYVFNDFFRSELFLQKFLRSRAKIITSIAMLYDLDDPGTFVADIVKVLDPHGIWVVQQNYLCSMLEQNGFDNVGHEHLTYYSLDTMSRLLQDHDLEIFDVEKNDVNGGSFCTYIARKGRFQVQDSVQKM
ncbi:MAG TPA: methyltransferase domain-containing protein, partial [Candidatus Bathyarchaeia archaeon]